MVLLKTITLTGGADAYSLPVSPNSSYNVGVGPYMPESSMTPGPPPPPMPDFTFYATTKCSGQCDF